MSWRVVKHTNNFTFPLLSYSQHFTEDTRIILKTLGSLALLFGLINNIPTHPAQCI